MKTVLITGVSRGIGKALAERFLSNGDFVIGTSTTGKADLNNSNLIVFPLDLSQAGSIKQCAEQIAGLNKKIDILINNAGTAVEEEVDTSVITIDYLRKILEVNLIGVIDFTEQIIPLIIDGGHIMNMSSRAGSLGSGEYKLNYPSYRISKTALNMATKIWASRLKGRVIVSSVNPGWVKTDMGGEDGEIEPSEAAENIFKLANANVETGQFWFKGEKFPW